MNKQLWQQAEALFEQSLTMDDSVRSLFVVERTAGQAELLLLVERMLQAEKDEAFMQTQPIVEVNESLLNDQS